MSTPTRNRPRVAKARSATRARSSARSSARSRPAKTWERLVKEERHMLVKAWDAKDPQKAFSDKIQKLHRRYTSGKKGHSP